MALVFFPVFEQFVEVLDEKLFPARKGYPTLCFLLFVAQRIVNLEDWFLVD
jgi:hypothetical protein